MVLAFFLLFISPFAHASESSLQVLDPAMESLVQLPISENQSAIFHDHESKFIGVIGDTTDWLGGGDVALKTDTYASLRETISKNTGMNFQSEETLKTVTDGAFKIIRARLLLRDGLVTIVVNEEHRIAPDNTSYSVYLVSLVENEGTALEWRERLAKKFTKAKSSSAKMEWRWFENFLIKSAHAAPPSEVSRSQGGPATARSLRVAVVDPKCADIGIKDPNRRRRLNEPPLTFWNGARSCKDGVWNAAKGIVEAFSGPSTTFTRLGIPPAVQRAYTSLNPIGMLGMKIAEGLVGLTTMAVTAVQRNRSAIFMMAWEATKNKKAQFLCLTNEAQMQVTCDVVANVATFAVPGGAAVKLARFGRIAGGAAEARMAAELSQAGRTVATAVPKVRQGIPRPTPSRPTPPRPPPAPRAAKPAPLVTRIGNFSVLRSGPQVTRASVVRQVRERFPTLKPGSPRIQVDLPSAPSSSTDKLNLNPGDTKAVNDWAESVLETAQKANPGTPLQIKNVDVGVGFNARESFVHIDNRGTYLHGSSTLQGGTSTIMFTKSGADKISAAQAAMRAQAEGGQIVVSKVISRNADGTMNVEIGLTKSEIPPQVVRMEAENFMQPPPGNTAIFSGSDHARASGGQVTEALHASPLKSEVPGEWDRVTFFINIHPK